MYPITPDTKVAELLEHWPALESVLIAQAPAFERLRNPVLRRTVARVATLEQAAAIAGISVRDLVLTLRRAAGLQVDAPDEAALSRPSPKGAAALCALTAVPHPQAEGGPAPGADGVTIDADALLDAGEVPLKRIFDAAGRLTAGDVLRIFVSFRPVPMLDKLESHGFHCECGTAPDGRFLISVTRARPAPS